MPSINPIVKYGLEEEVSMLRHEQDLSYRKIAEKISESKKLPAGKKVSERQVVSFFTATRETNKQIVKRSTKRLAKVVDQQVNIIDEVQSMYNRSKTLLEAMETAAAENGYQHVSPYHFKAVMSETREMLNTMISLQKDINDIENVKFFMQAVISILKKHAPEIIPVLIEELRVNKGTIWIASQLGTKGE